MKYLSKAEIGQMLIALVTIVGQVYFDLKLPDYMSDITTLVEKMCIRDRHGTHPAASIRCHAGRPAS